MRDILYCEELDRLVYLEAKATPEFWDSRWKQEGPPAVVPANDEVIVVTKKYLPAGARVLEGGCGRANKVKALADHGFEAIGIDFAEETVAQAKVHYPGLDVRTGDVRAMKLEDGHLDGYWSFGVIEHFWQGYDEIMAEAARVIRPGGYLFLTAPWFSPYRRSQARKGVYPAIDGSAEPDNFYQFGLGKTEVCAKLREHQFDVKVWRGQVAEISMRDDMPFIKNFMEWLLGSRGSIVKRVFRRALTRSLNNYCGHSFLVVAQRRPH